MSLVRFSVLLEEKDKNLFSSDLLVDGRLPIQSLDFFGRV